MIIRGYRYFSYLNEYIHSYTLLFEELRLLIQYDCVIQNLYQFTFFKLGQNI